MGFPRIINSIQKPALFVKKKSVLFFAIVFFEKDLTSKKVCGILFIVFSKDAPYRLLGQVLEHLPTPFQRESIRRNN